MKIIDFGEGLRTENTDAHRGAVDKTGHAGESTACWVKAFELHTMITWEPLQE